MLFILIPTSQVKYGSGLHPSTMTLGAMNAMASTMCSVLSEVFTNYRLFITWCTRVHSGSINSYSTQTQGKADIYPLPANLFCFEIVMSTFSLCPFHTRNHKTKISSGSNSWSRIKCDVSQTKLYLVISWFDKM